MVLDEYGIDEVRKQASNANIANKILDLLEKIEMDSNENNKRRWIWELIQNAKDVVNESQKIKINIDFSEKNKIIKFEHNGRLFTKENLVYLIQQVSTKDREVKGKEKRSTGKFGTGFLTTHLLSKIVNISGFYIDGDKIRKFKFKLDRSGTTKYEIINSIEESFEQLKNCEEVLKNSINRDDFNTCFTYKLDNEGIDVARRGIQDLNESLSYVFAFIPELELVSVSSCDDKYCFRREKIHDTKNSYMKVHEISIKRMYDEEKMFVCILKKENVSIAIPLKVLEDYSVAIDKFSKKVPRIFCDFPLVGTEDFAFPVIINSSGFNPTEPRDSIYLTDKNKDKIVENRLIIEKGIQLYDELLNYVADENWKSIYNIVRLRPQQNKDFISVQWVNDNVINRCKEIIKYKPIIKNEADEMIELFDDFFDCYNVWIINAKSKEQRESIWKLARYIYPKMLTKQVDIDNWYNSLWTECRNFSLKELVLKVEEFNTIEKLSDKLNDGIINTDWLNSFYNLISRDAEIKRYIIDKKVKVFPNQQGKFCSFDVLCSDIGIDNVYKNILKTLNMDVRSKLLNKQVVIDWVSFTEYNYDDVFREVKEGIKNIDNKEEIYRQIVVLYNETIQDNLKQDKLINYINQVFPQNMLLKIKVNKVSEELLEKSIKFLCKNLVNTISIYGNLDNLSSNIKLQKGTTIKEWLSGFIDYLVTFKYENFLNNDKAPILPNQKGIFKIIDELYLDSGEIDEILKDISCIAGNDIREKLLIKEVYLKLPENRTIYLGDIAQNIISFIKNNQGNKKVENQEKFNEFYMWLNENEEMNKKYFQELWSNKHWLLDDNQIATCMKKSELYDELLERYNINNLSSLEEMLKKECGNNCYENEEEIEITKECLAMYGIDSKEKLERAISLKIFGDNFIHESEHDIEKFKYVSKRFEESKKRVLSYLSDIEGYDVNSIKTLDTTIFLIKKYDEDLILIIRPSDFDQVILYYDSEKDVLDYEKDWELWVENGSDEPEKITFGKVLKLTGINKIPLKRIK